MTSQLIPAHTLPPTAHELAVYQTLADNAVESGIYKKSRAEIMMIMLAARELAIPPMQALNKGINCIKGSIELAARTMTMMIRRAGHSMTIVQLDKKGCIIKGKRCDNGDEMTCSFTWDDAAAAKLTSNPTWYSYTEDMLYSRALSRLARRLFADVIGTAYVEGEVSGGIPEHLEPKDVLEIQHQDDVAVDPLNTILANYPGEEGDVKEFLEEYASKQDTTLREAASRGLAKLEGFSKAYAEWKVA